MEKVAGDCVEVGLARRWDVLTGGGAGPSAGDTAASWPSCTRSSPALGRTRRRAGDHASRREVQRWKDALDACDEDLRADTDDIYERLHGHGPGALPSRILHGDFRTGNELAVDDHITAVIDWEIWSRSDPRIDLAWFLIFVEDERRATPAGMPSVES